MRIPATAHARQRQWQSLALLCRLGVGIAPIAADVSALLRGLVGADATALFWLDEQGRPAGFHHDDSPPAVKNLFLNEFERLFVGERELNIVALAQRQGPRVGRMMAPGADHFRSNTYNLLIRPNGHHHTLDMRVEVPGPGGPVTRAVVALFRAPGTGFGAAEAELLERAGRVLALAFAPAGQGAAGGMRSSGTSGHVLVDAANLKPLSADAAAVQLLQEAHIPGLGLYGANATALPPDLFRHLGMQPGQSKHLPVPKGVLHVHTHPLRHCNARDAGHWLLTLQLRHPCQIDMMRRVLALPLTPMQREIAALAGLGHPRSDCARHTGVGAAALKKHLNAILDVVGASDWDGLAQALRT